MGEHQQPLPGPSRFRFSSTARIFLKEYYHTTNKAPKKKERERIFAYLKELGESEVTDARITRFFASKRQNERKNFSLPPLTSVPDSNETKWVDAHHETLWPSLTRESLKDLEELYTELVADNPNAKIPCEPWAKILDARPVHVRMWCKIKMSQSKRKSRGVPVPVPEAPSQVTEERSQLPTPENSTSPEPLIAFVAPDAVKDEPLISPVEDTTPFRSPQEATKGNTSMRLHEAIQSAFYDTLHSPPPVTQPLKPSSTTELDHQRNQFLSYSHRVTSPPAPSLVPAASDPITSASISLPPVTITSPLQSQGSPPSPHQVPSTPPLPEESAPGPHEQPDRALARKRAALLAGIAEKLDELDGMFNSAHGLAQFAGSIENISRRNEEFLKDVSVGRFAHMRLTSAHLPDRQVAHSMSMPEYNPLRLLAELRNGKGKGKEGDIEVEMQVD